MSEGRHMSPDDVLAEARSLITEGTPRQYMKGHERGCKCDECRPIHTAYMRWWRAVRQGRPSVSTPVDTLAALLDAAAEREALAAKVEALAAKVEALADWHETKAEKARRFRVEINGENRVMDKAAEVHTDATRRLRALTQKESA